MSQTSLPTAGFRLRIQGQHPVGEMLLLVGRSTIGRHADNTLALNDIHVSGYHAQIDCTLTTCQLQDLKSSNGTTVNGQLCQAYDTIFLTPGDVIGIALSEETGRPLFVLTLEQIPITLPATDHSIVSAALDQIPAATVTLAEQAAALGLAPGLWRSSYRLLEYLPEIYQQHGAEEDEDPTESFTARFLALFESVLLPVEWTVDNFDLFLDPATAPADFLPWLANWFAFTFDADWNDEQRRALLKAAHMIYQLRGTSAALAQLVTIYAGVAPIIDDSEQLPAGLFTVTLPATCATRRSQIEALIDRHKPAHAVCSLIFHPAA